jgi:enamine deaminase RidA (YjgF/YER057c/UK114 family)
VLRLGGEPPSPYESRYGYSRIVVAGPFILIGGTTSVDELGFVVGLTPYEQAIEILGKVERHLARVDAALTDVVQVRASVTDISRIDDVGRAFSEVFGEIRPILTGVEVSALIDPRMLVELEVVAYRAR